jgi:uncharacterized SAM-binding protein YcdF (DUF218 family)
MIAFLCGCTSLVLWGKALRALGQRHLLLALGATAFFGVTVVVAPSGLILQKTLGRLLLPFGLLWMGLVLWALWLVVIDARARAIRVAALALSVTVLGNEPLGEWMCARLEEPYGGDPLAEAPFDAVIVLGGGVQGAPYGGYELGPAGDRILLGARLFFARRTPLLVTTGTPIAGFEQPLDSTVATTELWRSIGIPLAAVIAVSETRTTSEEAKACARLVRSRGWHRVGLVTSAWHLRRAVRLFQREGVNVVPLAADHQGTPTWEGLYSVVPVGVGAWRQQKAVWEWIGAAVGR